MKKPAARETNNKSAAANDGPPTSRDVAFPGEWVCKSRRPTCGGRKTDTIQVWRPKGYRCGHVECSIPTEMLQRVALNIEVFTKEWWWQFQIKLLEQLEFLKFICDWAVRSRSRPCIHRYSWGNDDGILVNHPDEANVKLAPSTLKDESSSTTEVFLCNNWCSP